ncbi:putative histone acetyltransferase subunit protein [Venturia nashicola]|uniref:Putative histone acetyltransferase subunit protein n=1 Tax=Venturia nashicola TaxID=86259 RepID=A0A4Z1PEL9_9PEZI|nr:putative histone acetyltransferase subunit protein [Venturia nashicola]TLD39729.1 putative histone acetyltransferase subunit protein [Venturia nashicola]
MSALSKIFRPKTAVPLATNLVAIGAATLYIRSHLIFNHEEAEARMDEIEGTLRGHIGLIENSLERLELETGSKKQDAKGGLKS